MTYIPPLEYYFLSATQVEDVDGIAEKYHFDIPELPNASYYSSTDKINDAESKTECFFGLYDPSDMHRYWEFPVDVEEAVNIKDHLVMAYKSHAKTGMLPKTTLCVSAETLEASLKIKNSRLIGIIQELHPYAVYNTMTEDLEKGILERINNYTKG